METTSASLGPAFQLILLAAFLIPCILFLLTQFNTLRLIKGENRTLQPGWVWLQLIPAVGQIWQFVVVTRISSSIRKQWQAADEDSILGIDADTVATARNSKPTLAIGITYCTLNAACIFFNLFLTAGPNSKEAMIVGSTGLISVVCWVIYWVALAGWKRRLKNRVRFTI